ncbi:hypothetical protein [Methylobacterium sp. J-092]|uniref:hypothetical protein n=1 Tax=Methylobacterium sp. J-092 TaxID=2836667 RepID=UPI001FB9CED9|nr:hypothetical protein [Methylobacterium sp. J-092]MCJ2010447.1 hypothetical protein [Methylobacterium sp. J-092]
MVEATAPGWRDVRSPPESVRQRFPSFAIPIGRLADLDRRDLIELVWLFPKKHQQL